MYSFISRFNFNTCATKEQTKSFKILLCSHPLTQICLRLCKATKFYTGPNGKYLQTMKEKKRGNMEICSRNSRKHC